MTDLQTTRPRALGRVAGALYLIVIAAAAYAVSVRSAVVKPGDAAATADGIRASATEFRAAFVVDLVNGAVFLLTAFALYLLLQHVNRRVAAAMVGFVAIGCAVSSLNLLNHLTALTIATDDRYTQALGKTGADALTL